MIYRSLKSHACEIYLLCHIHNSHFCFQSAIITSYVLCLFWNSISSQTPKKIRLNSIQLQEIFDIVKKERSKHFGKIHKKKSHNMISTRRICIRSWHKGICIKILKWLHIWIFGHGSNMRNFNGTANLIIIMLMKHQLIYCQIHIYYPY